MLNITYDPSRPYADGQYYVELVQLDPTDQRRCSRLGYWCDRGHLESGIAMPVLAQFNHKIFKKLLED